MVNLPGIKEDELAKLGLCVICQQTQLGHGDITFYKVEISRAAFDARALERRVGLEMQLGNSMLARHMGPDADLAKVFDGPHTVFVHESCAARVGHLLELIPDTDEEKKASA